METIYTKILLEFVRNSRISTSELARVLGISREHAEKWVKKLESDEIVKQYTIMLNPHKFGYDTWQVYLKANLKEEEQGVLIRYLESNKKIIKAVKCAGEYDYVLWVIAKDAVDFHNQLDEIKKEIEERELAIKKINYSLQIKTSTAEKSNEKITFADKKIIEVLRKDSRTPVSEIQKQTGLTQRIIGYRINELIRKEIIRYHLKLDLDKIGKERYKILLKLKCGCIDGLLKFSKKQPLIKSVTKSIGSHDLEIRIDVETHQELLELMNQIEHEFSSLIENYQTIMIKEEIKSGGY